MNVHLTPELEKLVHGKVETGNYNSASEVVREALRLMQERDQFKLMQTEEIRKKIAAGLESLRQGKGIDGELFMAQMDAELEEEIRAEEERKITLETVKPYMRGYIISPEAAEDLRQIGAYLVQEAGAQVTRLILRKITEAFLFLSRTPGAGHTREELTQGVSKGIVKVWSVFSYIIIYNSAVRPIAIVRVLHGRRDLADLLSPSEDG